MGQPVELTNSIGMKLVLIPPREFLMGSPRSESGRHDGETQHRVRITAPYYPGMYEVTQSEYERVMGTNPSVFSRNGERSERVSGQDTSRFPVERVSWEEAVEFCRKLSAMPAERSAGRVYRLPTEAEWEFACRAGTTTTYHFGSQLNGREENCNGDHPYGTMARGTYLRRTTAVGSYTANGFGLHDLHGNMSEWCSDWYGDYPNVPVDDPKGPPSGWIRVLRGGSWFDAPKYCRSAYRSGLSPDLWMDAIGFRVVCTLVNP